MSDYRSAPYKVYLAMVKRKLRTQKANGQITAIVRPLFYGWIFWLKDDLIKAGFRARKHNVPGYKNDYVIVLLDETLIP